MDDWKDISRNSWSFSREVVVGYGGGSGKYLTSYAINTAYGTPLNGMLAAELRIGSRHATGAGLVCRADELMSFVAFYVAPRENQENSTTLRISVFQEGVFLPLAASVEDVVLDDGFNKFSLRFFSGLITGTVSTTHQEYRLEAVVPHIPFPGYIGLVKFYGAGVTVKNFLFEEISRERSLVSGEAGENTFEYDVFISYASEDRSLVDQIVERFRNAGVRYWVDYEQTSFGDDFIGKLEEGLNESKYVLVCLSVNLGRSNWARVEYGSRLNEMFSRNSGDSERKVIPLKLDNVGDENIPYLLRNIQRADFWNMDEFNQLIDFLKQ